MEVEGGEKQEEDRKGDGKKRCRREGNKRDGATRGMHRVLC